MYLLCHDAVHRLYPSRAPAVGVRRLHTGHNIPLWRMVVGVEETRDALMRSCCWIVWLCLCDPTPLQTSNLQSRDRDFALGQMRMTRKISPQAFRDLAQKAMEELHFV